LTGLVPERSRGGEFGCVFGERDVRVAGLSMATPGR
jgi:hypothetical protein